MQHRRPVLAALLGAAVLAGSYAYAQQHLDLRVGQWSFTMTGMGGLAAGATQLPPEVRAKLEEIARQPMTYPACLTEKDLEQLNLSPPDDDENCEVTSRKLTGKTLEMTRTCKGPKPHDETIRVEALSPESLKATVTGTSSLGPINLTLTGKWIGATCTEE